MIFIVTCHSPDLDAIACSIGYSELLKKKGKGFNVFIAFDSESDKFFSRVLGVQKIGGGYKMDNIIMRKQIWPRVEKILSVINQN